MENWQVPKFKAIEFAPKRTKYCVVIFVMNEGENIKTELGRVKHLCNDIDIIIADANSTDGSTEHEFLKQMGVNTLIVRDGKDNGRYSADMRRAFAYALNRGYEGIITEDGNNKDSIEDIPKFIQALDEDFDFVQGSRFAKGGRHENTPLIRFLALKLLHNPILNIPARYKWTETACAFRGHSRRFLLDERVSIFRDVFLRHELSYYLQIKAPRLGYKVKEIPITRLYPSTGKIPTKITFTGNFVIFATLIKVALGKYNPKI
jgi:glycosyltransferase involved in cell wall biosynthesis